MDTRQRILVVDDEETLCEALRFNLEAEGFDVTTALSAEDALTLDLASFNLILLDIMMGGLSGTQLATILKKRHDTARIPIIFCTARDSVDDMVGGLDLGADDYITKPYSIKNILARIKAALRRTAPAANSGQMEADKSPYPNYTNYTNYPPSAPAPDLLEYQGLRISLISKVCSVGGREVRMPRKEFEILALLMSRPGRVFTRQEILDAVWPREVVVLDRVVDVNITRLRTKLGPYGHLIVTKTGYGYVFTD